MSSLNSGDIAVTTVQQPRGTGEKYSVTSTSIGLGYGHRLTDRFSAGLQVNFIRETIWHSSLTALAVNFGTLYQVSPDGLHIGASLSNFGTRAAFSGTDLRIRYDNDASTHGDNSNLPGEVFTEEFSLPIVFRVGLAYPFRIDDDNGLHLAVDAFHPSDNTESVSFGAEWKLLNTFAIRAGYQHLFQEDSQVGLTLGGGIEYSFFEIPFRIDYAWASHNMLKGTQRLTVGFEF
jgi:long-subunit fatty acid transport protein